MEISTLDEDVDSVFCSPREEALGDGRLSQVWARTAACVQCQMAAYSRTIAPMGNGEYHVGVEGSSDEGASFVGNVSYETDSGVVMEGHGAVDTNGNVSGGVSVGGTF